MEFAPVVPIENDGSINIKHLKLAEEICEKSAALQGSHNNFVIEEVVSLLRKTNSYYSNRIESEGTHPIDIDKAMKKEFSDNEKKRSLQKLSLAHIEVQKFIEGEVGKNLTIYSKEFILEIHNQFYSQGSMEAFLHIQYKDLETTMVPGELREREVYVGEHIAPSNDTLNSLLGHFENMYNISQYKSKAEQLIYALCSHHRLVWIHPFSDGNGRVSRLFLDYLLFKINIKGYGLWNIARGLARNVDEYKSSLKYADMIQQGSQDGRGPLSKRGLDSFLTFMLQTALDQVDYMTKYLKIQSMGKNIENYVKLSQLGFLDIEPLPKYTALLFKELLMKGSVPRGEVAEIIDKSSKTASNLMKILLDKDYLSSKHHKAPISLQFNSHFASYIIPELIPQNKE
jgi:Fic family protein